LNALEQKFEAEFQRLVATGSKRPLLFALIKTFKKEFFLGAICQLMTAIAQTVSPFILRFLISFATEAFNAKQTGDHGPNIGYGVGLVVIVTALQVVMTFSINHFLYWGMTVGGEARGVLMSLIFAKSLRISSRAKAGGYILPPPTNAKPGNNDEKGWLKKAVSKPKGAKDDKKQPPPADDNDTDGWSNGRIVNLMSTDTYRIDQASGMIHMLWGSPLSIIITMVLLIINLGYSALPGLGLLFLCTPALTAAIRGLFKRRFAINKITDQRVSLTTEILQSIRFVKFFGWETSFLERIQAIRKREIRSIQALLAIRDAIQALGMAVPVFASMLSFITYALTSHNLSPAPIFSSLALFNGLRVPLQSKTTTRPFPTT
jgi:ATP-binding cassette, subfamily C (CFTR/MRP), member 1